MNLYQSLPAQFFDAVQHPEKASPEILYALLFFRFQQLLERDYLWFSSNCDSSDAVSERRSIVLHGEATDLAHLLGDQALSCALEALTAFGQSMDPDVWRAFLYGGDTEGRTWDGLYHGYGYFSTWALELHHADGELPLPTNGPVSEN